MIYDDAYVRATAVSALRLLAEREVEQDSPLYHELHDVAEAFEQRNLSLIQMEPCHLIDPAGEALCYADITGREPHDREACVEGGHALCARCVAIERVQGEDE